MTRGIGAMLPEQDATHRPRQPEARQILERLADCDHLAQEVDRLDIAKFRRAINGARKLVLESERK